MSKTYIKPETITIKMELQQIMAGSGVQTGSTPGQEYTGGDKTYSKQFEFLEEQEESTRVSVTNEEDWDEFEEEE